MGHRKQNHGHPGPLLIHLLSLPGDAARFLRQHSLLICVEHCTYALGNPDIEFQIYLPCMWKGAIIEERDISC